MRSISCDWKAAFDMEIRAQAGVALQPVFVVALQPVDAPVAKDEEGHRAVYLVIVFQTGYLVILVEAVLELGRKLVIGLIADTQHVEPVVFQLPAELPVVGWKLGERNTKFFISDPAPFVR